MEQKTDNKDGDGGGNRGLTLTDIFFFKNKKRVLRRKIVHNITSFASVHQTFRLLLTCKEMVAAEEKIFQGYQLPMVCDMGGDDGSKLYCLMTRTPNSRWLEWLGTSGVKELQLPTRMENEEMLIMFGDSEGRFSELQSLNLWGCKNITDASLLKVVKQCSNLQSLDLTGCENITDASLAKVGRGCSNLLLLNLSYCQNITDASLSEVGRGCSNLQTLNLYCCTNITDASLVEVARGCLKLQTLKLPSNITDAAVSEVARGCSNLQTLKLPSNITDAAVSEVARGCSNLQTLDLLGCTNITDASVMEVARRCSNLQSLDLGGCENITNASLAEIARRCLNLQTLNLEESGIGWRFKYAMRQSHPQLELMF